MEESIRKQIKSHMDTMGTIERELVPAIARIASLIADALKSGRKLLVMGNGGSAADAQHLAAEIVGRYKMERRAMPAIALTTDTSILTAVGNDYGFDTIFRRQVEALAANGDVVVGISTSGSSPNVSSALVLARQLGCTTVGLLGKDGGSIKDCVDFPLVVPGNDTARIQEGHITIIHIICDLVERQLFSAKI